MASSVLDDVNSVLSSTTSAANDVAAVRQAMGMPDPRRQPGLVSSALKSGVAQLEGLGGAAASALGGAVGYQPLQQWGADISKAKQAEAAKYVPADVAVAPWREGGGGWGAVPKWAAYTALEQIPLAAATVAGTALFPEAAVPAIAARAGAAIPEFFGGGGLRAAMTAAEQQAAKQTGAEYARRALGAGIVGTPVGTGSMYQQALERPGGPTQEDAIKSLALGPVYGAMEGAGGALGRSIISEAATKGAAATIGRAALRGAAEEVPTEAAQTAMELSFRPDMSAADKMSQIVDAAITGSVVGGVFSGAAGVTNIATSGVRETKTTPPGQLRNEDILGAVDRDLGILPAAATKAAEPSAALAEPAPPTPSAAPAPSVEPSAPPMMAQIEEAQAPSEPKAPPEEPPSARVRLALADALGGQTKQNLNIVNRLGEIDSLPAAANKVLDLLEAGDAKKSTFRLATALGITDAAGNRRDLDAEIDATTQRLTAAQIPQQRAELTAQLDQLETQRQLLTSAAELRAAVRPAPVVEEMLPPVARAAEIAPAEKPYLETGDVLQFTNKKTGETFEAPISARDGRIFFVNTPQGGFSGSAFLNTYDWKRVARAPETAPAAPAPAAPTPAMQAMQAANIPARAQIKFVRGFNAAINQETAPTRGFAAQGYQAGQDYLRAQAAPEPVVIPTTQEIPSAVQEQGPTSVYVQPTAETGGAVGERDTQGREVAGARVEAAPEVAAPEVAAPQEIAPAPAPSPTAAKFMRQQGIKQLSPEERAAARERQQAETQAYLEKRQKQIGAATRQNLARGGAATPTGPTPMTPQEFLARRNREREMAAPAGLAAEPSELDNDVLSLVENQASGAQVLNYLAENSPDEITRVYAKHFTRLGVAPRIQVADVNDPSLDINWEAAADRRIYGSYNVEQDRINLYERANAAQIVMHEATHAATIKGVATNTPAAQKLRDVFADFSARPEKYEGATPAYDDVEEFISEAFSNPQFQEYLKGQKSGRQTLWEKFKDAVFRLLRLPQSARSMFDDVIDLGNELFAESAAVPRDEALSALEAAQRAVESPMSVDKTFKAVSNTLGKGVEKFNRTASLAEATRRTALGWQSITHMAARYGSLFTSNNTNWIQKYADYNQQRAAVAARMSQLFKAVYDDYTALESRNPVAAETVRKLMALTEFNMDWRKSWAAQTWLHGEKNADDLRKLHSDMRNEGGRLDKSAKELFDRLEAVNNVSRYAQMSLSLYSFIVSDPNMANNIANSDVDPIDEFLQKSALHENPSEAQAYWQRTLKAQLAETNKFVRAQHKIVYNPKKHTRPEQEAARRVYEPLKSLVDSTEKTMEVMKQSPNFHLGRFGDYMVTFKIRHDKNIVDADAKDRVAAAMDAAGVQAQISPENNSPAVFIRVETQEQAEKLRQLAVDMQKRGWLDPESEPKAGLRTDTKSHDVVNPNWLQKYIEAISDSPEFSPAEDATAEEKAQAVKARETMVSRARELYINMLPDNALAKVLTQRKGVPGYSKDMMRSFAFRHQIGMNAIANLATAHRISQTLTEMRQIVNAAKTGPVSETVKLQNIFGEISQRELERPIRPQNSFWDSVRAFNHAYFLGASPSYVLVNMTQPGVLLWPELAKQHGFVKSAKALANVTPTAFKIMKAVLTTGKSADAIITEKVLNASGIDEPTAEFVMRVANTGNLDLGSTSRELGRVVEGEIDSRVDQTLRWAAAAGYYSETFTRLAAALAARELYSNKSNTAGMMEYVNKTINESMLNYSTWNTARKTGKMGVAGEYTPVMFSFMTYQFQVLEKMYRELRDAFGGSREAQRFLAGHLGALTVLAGSLGLPFASVAARAFDALKDVFGDDEEPADVKSAWRNFLADMFGKEVGEVLARGAPRALGFDVSSRVGEADLLPFSRILTDRREIRDAAKDAALHTLGSPVSMLLNILDGLDKAVHGDVIEGFQEIVPTAIKGPLAAYRMAADGRYVDNKDRELPMEPGAQDVLMQALGFTPAAKAEYTEASMAQTVRKGLLTREAARLRDQLADAIIDRTPDQQELIRQAQAFDRAHPERPILPTISATVRRRRQGLEQAKALRTPLGVKPQDIGARGLTEYMNTP